MSYHLPSGDLLTLFGLTLAFKAPYSLFLPLAYEPVLVAFGRLEPPLLVATVAVLGTIAMEWVNYHCFRAVLRCRWAAGVGRTATASRLVRRFERRPFLTITACALLPFPFGITRIVALLACYPVGPYLAATAVGRFPRYWSYAIAGTLLPVSSPVVITAAVLAVAAPLILLVSPPVRNRCRPS